MEVPGNANDPAAGTHTNRSSSSAFAQTSRNLERKTRKKRLLERLSPSPPESSILRLSFFPPRIRKDRAFLGNREKNQKWNKSIRNECNPQTQEVCVEIWKYVRKTIEESIILICSSEGVFKMKHSGKPEQGVAPAELFYNDEEAEKYNSKLRRKCFFLFFFFFSVFADRSLVSTRVREIQRKMSERAVQLLALPPDATNLHLLDVGCGSGLSGEVHRTKPKTKNQKPKTKNQNPKSKKQKPKTKNKNNEKQITKRMQTYKHTGAFGAGPHVDGSGRES